jgi:hypothetical protein
MVIPPSRAMPMTFRASAPVPEAITKWEDTQNKGEGRHKNGSEARFGCLYSSIKKGQSVFKFVIGKFHDQNGIFSCHSNQHDKGDLRKDVVLETHAKEAGDPQEGQGTKNGKGCSQQNGKGQAPTLILRR